MSGKEVIQGIRVIILIVCVFYFVGILITAGATAAGSEPETSVVDLVKDLILFLLVYKNIEE